MEKNLPVVYKSQFDPDASQSFNDCGACSVAMVLNFLGANVTTDQVQEKTGAGGSLVTIEQLQNAIKSLGFMSEFYTNQTFDSLKKMLDKDLPVICLVHYGSLNSTQDKEFKGGHFIPVVGYRADNGIYANDPNFKEDLRSQGDHHNYTNEEFMAAWGECYLDQNPPYSFLVITKPALPQEKLEKVVVIADKGLNARSAPNRIDKPVASFGKDTVLEVVSTTTGEDVNGNAQWMVVKNNNTDVFIWSGGVQPVKVEKPKEEKPKEVKPVEDKDKIIKQLRKDNQRLIEVIKQMNKLTEGFIKVEEAPVEKKVEVESNVKPVSQNAFNNLLQLLHLK